MEMSLQFLFYIVFRTGFVYFIKKKVIKKSLKREEPHV